MRDSQHLVLFTLQNNNYNTIWSSLFDLKCVWSFVIQPLPFQFALSYCASRLGWGTIQILVWCIPTAYNHSQHFNCILWVNHLLERTNTQKCTQKCIDVDVWPKSLVFWGFLISTSSPAIAKVSPVRSFLWNDSVNHRFWEKSSVRLLQVYWIFPDNLMEFFHEQGNEWLKPLFFAPTWPLEMLGQPLEMPLGQWLSIPRQTRYWSPDLLKWVKK